MPRWETDDLHILFEKLWDKGYDLYPSITWPIPGVQMVDPSNEDKELAYRRGCCDGIELLVKLLSDKNYLSGCERLNIEKYVKTIRQNNGL